MEKLSGDRTRHLARGSHRASPAATHRRERRGRSLPWLVAVLALVAQGPVASSAEAGVDLIGTWHVLVHYRDSGSNNPEAERWLDRVWVFERQGDRLRWTDYPIVVFDQEAGRFERRETGQYARTLQYWEPSPSQRANIRRGLQVNDRGSRAKTLRGSDAEGWSSGSRARPGSASTITFTETWRIEGLPDRPVFTREEMLGSGSSDSLEGLTRYETRDLTDGGDKLEGLYRRDGRQRGYFTMRRAGEQRALEGSGKTQGQRVMEAFFGDWAEAVQAGPEALQAEIERRLADGDLTEEERARLAEEIRRSLGLRIEKLTGDPAELEIELDRVTREIQQQIEQGRSMEEIGQMLEDGEIGRAR